MNLGDLPLDTLTTALLNSAPEDLINFCQVNPRAIAVCQSQQFLFEYVLNRYGVNINTILGNTAWEKFIAIYRLVKKANAIDPNNNFTKQTYKSLFGLATPVGIKHAMYPWYINQPFRDMLVQVAQTNNLQLFQLIFNILTAKLNANNTGLIIQSFRDAFLVALNNNNPHIIQLITQYYNPNNDPILRAMFKDAIISGDLNLVKLLTQYFRVDNEHINQAMQYNQPQMADLLRSMLG